MLRGKDRAFAIPHDVVKFFVAAMGNTTSAPTVPLNGPQGPTVSTFPIAVNGIDKTTAGAPTRTSAGLYVITYAHQLVSCVPGSACVVSAGAAPTAALEATILILDPVARQATVVVSVPSTGVATDLGTSDMLVLVLHGIDTNAP